MRIRDGPLNGTERVTTTRMEVNMDGHPSGPNGVIGSRAGRRRRAGKRSHPVIPEKKSGAPNGVTLGKRSGIPKRNGTPRSGIRRNGIRRRSGIRIRNQIRTRIQRNGTARNGTARSGTERSGITKRSGTAKRNGIPKRSGIPNGKKRMTVIVRVIAIAAAVRRKSGVNGKVGGNLIFS